MSSSPSRPKVLTAAFVRSINRPGRYGDGRGGHGLSLLVKLTANGRWSKTWAQRLRIGGRTVSLGLGSYPAVSLALARERALANRQAVEEGRDPRRLHAATFAEAMEAVIDLHRPNWKPTSNTEQQWRSLLAHHIDATIGSMPVADVAAADVVAVLDRVWDRPELARRTARRISTTMKWAMGRGLRETDPHQRLSPRCPNCATARTTIGRCTTAKSPTRSRRSGHRRQPPPRSRPLNCWR